jgi:hypothetical protein
MTDRAFGHPETIAHYIVECQMGGMPRYAMSISDGSGGIAPGQIPSPRATVASMARKERDTTVLSFRVPNPLAEAIYTRAGTEPGAKDGALTAWLIRTLQQALTGKAPGASVGFEEGKRQGWAHANKVFREALGEAAEKLK